MLLYNVRKDALHVMSYRNNELEMQAEQPRRRLEPEDIMTLLGMVWLFYFATIGTLSIWLMNQPFALFAVNVLEMEDHRKNNPSL